jgi:hypothetical protein
VFVFSKNNRKLFEMNTIVLSDFASVNSVLTSIEDSSVTNEDMSNLSVITELESGIGESDESPLIYGMILGKPYIFKAFQANNKIEVATAEKIEWAYSYTTEQGVISGIFQDAKEFTVSLTINTANVCGRYLTIFAFMQDRKIQASIKIWVHFRFRYFSRTTIKKEIGKRLVQPYLISQNATSLCGMAAVFYLFAKTFPVDYQEIALELYRKGEVTRNKYTIKPHSSMYEVEPVSKNKNYPGFRKYADGSLMKQPELMPQADWVVLASARSSLSYLGYNGKAGEDFKAINWGRIVKKLLKDFFGYSSVLDKTSFYTGFNYKETLLEIQKDFLAGYQLIFLIDSNMLSDKVTYIGNAVNWHYIVYEGDLFFDQDKNYQFSFYSWGKIFKNQSIRSSVFNSTFYGYYKIKT